MLENEHLMTLEVTLSPPIEIGQTPMGFRRIIPITGGTMTGRINGKVLPGGADWNLVREDGVTYPWARYTLQTDDGVNIMITNEGMMSGMDPKAMEKILANEPLDFSNFYCITRPVFEVDMTNEKYSFLNDRTFIGKLTPGGPLDVRLDYYEVKHPPLG